MPQTITIELPDAVAHGLQVKATHQGKDIASVAALLLAERLEADAAAFDPETIAGIKEGIADGDAGRWQPLEEYIAEMEGERTAKQAETS